MKKSVTLAAAIIGMATLLSGCGLFGSKKGETPSVQPVAVSVTQAEKGRITAQTVASGQIEPTLSVYITAKVGGRVVSVRKEMGDQVKAGDLLAELEDRDAANQLTQALANVAQAEAQRAEVERQLNRLKNLLAAGAVSKQQMEQVETQLALVTAQVTAARATADLASNNLERTRITAPADGVLAARMVEPGAMVGTSNPVFQLVDLSTVVVKTGVAERDVNSVQPGAAVPVVVPALNNQEFTGKVEAISPNMDRQTRSYQVKVTLPNPKGVLKGGMFAQVKFPVRELEGILLPVEAVLDRNGETAVFVVSGGVAHQKKVTVTVTSGNKVAVEGIEAGAQVVTAGQNRLYDGAPVKAEGSKTP